MEIERFDSDSLLNTIFRYGDTYFDRIDCVYVMSV